MNRRHAFLAIAIDLARETLASPLLEAPPDYEAPGKIYKDLKKLMKEENINPQQVTQHTHRAKGSSSRHNLTYFVEHCSGRQGGLRPRFP
jgi:hypothetical protein